MGLWVRGPPLIRGIMLHHNEMRICSLILQWFLTSLVWSETQRVRLAHQNLATNIKPLLQWFSPSYQQHFFSALYQFTSFLSAADLALHVFQSVRSFKWPDLLLTGQALEIGPALEVGGAGRREAVCDGESRPDWTELKVERAWAPVRWCIWFWNYSHSYFTVTAQWFLASEIRGGECLGATWRQIKKKKQTSKKQGVAWQQVSFVFHQRLTTAPRCQTQRDWIIALERSWAILSRNAPGRAFVTLSVPFKSRIMGFFFSLTLSFYLARQPSKWKVFLTFSIISAFNSPTVSHLPSFPSIPLSFSVFLQRRLFISGLTIAGLLILFDVPRSLSDESIRDKRREKTPVRGMFQLLMQLSDKRCLRRNILPVLQKTS